MLAEVDRLAEGPLAASFADGDRNPPVFDPATHSVTMPRVVQEVVQGLHGRRVVAPGPARSSAATRPAAAASGRWPSRSSAPTPPLHMYAAGAPFAAHPVPQRQRDAEADRPADGRPRLGRHDGAHRAGRRLRRRRRAHQGDPAARRHLAHRGRQALHHLGRARHDREHRAPRAGPARGRRPGHQGAVAVRRARSSTSTSRPASSASATASSSPTSSTRWASRPRPPASCSFGETRSPAVGWLVGDVHDGIAQMFQVIEHARMMVGTKAIATLSTGYLNALDYAKSRVQCADLTQATDKTAPRVTIIHHPDVRRSLMLQKAYAEGLRALVLYTASWQDKIIIGRHEGDASQPRRAVNDLLLPDRQGRRLRALLRPARPGAADLRRFRLPAGLPDRAVHSRREDRHALRGHHGHPGPGLLLPQDRPEQGRRAGRAVCRDRRSSSSRSPAKAG